MGLSEMRQMAVFGGHALSLRCNFMYSAANVFNMDLYSFSKVQAFNVERKRDKNINVLS